MGCRSCLHDKQSRWDPIRGEEWCCDRTASTSSCQLLKPTWVRWALMPQLCAVALQAIVNAAAAVAAAAALSTTLVQGLMNLPVQHAVTHGGRFANLGSVIVMLADVHVSWVLLRVRR